VTPDAVTAQKPQRTFAGQPRALSTLFFTEMWERFSYYGMRAILVLYLTASITSDGPGGPGLGIADGTAIGIYGAYTGLVFLTPIAGGWIADRLLGARRTVLYGGIVIALGHYCMATPVSGLFWFGLLLIALGTGLLKPNISAMVGDLYTETDIRRDAGFSIFYMGINIGSFLAPLLTGFAANRYGFHWGFAIAGIGMTLGVIQYVAGHRRLHGVGDIVPNPALTRDRAMFAAMLGAAVAFVAVVTGVLMVSIGEGVANAVPSAITILILIMPIFYFRQLLRNRDRTPIERDHVKAFIWVFLGAAAFWMVFEQSGSTLTLFAEQVTDLHVWGWEMPAGWMQSVNPLFIIIFAPVFAALWTKLANRAPRTPVKFAISLMGVGLSFLILIPPMADYQNSGEEAAMWWLICTYLIQTWAELLLSPPGLSATSKLAPVGGSGQMLALWFLATSVGTSVGGQIGRLTVNNPVNTFAVCAAITIVLGVLLLLVRNRISALMHEVH